MINKTKEHKNALMKISHFMLKGMREYVESNDFFDLSLQMPNLTNVTGSCEQVSNLFSTEVKKEKIAFLPQSLQLYLELFTPSFEQVYCLVPSFRKESEVDNRHLMSFPLFEIEHAGNLDLLIFNLTGILQSAIKKVIENCKKELNIFGRDLKDLEKSLTFKRITYSEAIDLLNGSYGYSLSFGDDLKAEHEAKIVEYFKLPTFVTHYPKKIKFFNMKDNDVNPEIVNSCDLLLPFSGESAGAAQRETNIHKICEKLINHSMYKMLKEINGTSDSDFDWYLSAHITNKSMTNILGCYRDTPEFLTADEPISHSGAGIGCSRVLQFIIGSNDIRDAMVYPINAETIL